MAKVAILVKFDLTTRLVIDVPEGVEVEKFIEDDESLFDDAKNKIVGNIDDYLCPENCYCVLDEECPAKENEELS